MGIELSFGDKIFDESLLICGEFDSFFDLIELKTHLHKFEFQFRKRNIFLNDLVIHFTSLVYLERMIFYIMPKNTIDVY